MAFRITYSVLNADMTEIHNQFDGALSNVKKSLGRDYPSWIDGEPYMSQKFLEDYNPADTRQLLARFHEISEKEIDRIFSVSKKAQSVWGKTPWQERVRIIRKAADLISDRRLELAAIMSLEVGKSRMESLGDVEESADLFRYYATQLEEAHGFTKPLGKLSPNENSQSILKPYGVFVVISPFNFPLALAAGMSGGALLGGNSVILKPSREAPWCAQKLYEVLRDAGLPRGVFQLVYGSGSTLGRAMLQHPSLDGVVFTGSKVVAMQILKDTIRDYPKPIILEMGGKNPAIVSEKADLEKAIEGCARSAFGLSGQKCSALSRLYVQRSIKDKFLRGLVEKSKSFKIGDPLERDIFIGPVINAQALKRHQEAVAQAKRDGKILFGGEELTQAPFNHGYFAAPTIAEMPRGHKLLKEELFSPFLCVDSFNTLAEAIEQANLSEYGLTAGIFSEDKKEVDTFMDHMDSGVLYANRRTGATTGAWPGVQAFCGWKSSGSTGKGGCGPYYVAQFMREQSQTRME